MPNVESHLFRVFCNRDPLLPLYTDKAYHKPELGILKSILLGSVELIASTTLCLRSWPVSSLPMKMCLLEANVQICCVDVKYLCTGEFFLHFFCWYWALGFEVAGRDEPHSCSCL
jgi:hypothetical protein